MSEIDVYKEWLGIPADVRPPNHYTLLRLVMFEDDAEKVRANYRKLNAHVRKYATGQYLLRSQELDRHSTLLIFDKGVGPSHCKTILVCIQC